MSPYRTYFIPLKDKDVPKKHQPTLAKYRAQARRQKVPKSVPLCYKVRAGFTLKQHAPQVGPCYEGFQYLQNWGFPDEPTKECLVFWIPRIVPGSVKKNVSEQMAHLAELRAQTKLPSHHLASFGSSALLAGLILAHFKVTGERVPLDDYWVRTDTCSADGSRLSLHWFEGSLRCGAWHWGGERRARLAAFALGVELGSLDT